MIDTDANEQVSRIPRGEGDLAGIAWRGGARWCRNEIAVGVAHNQRIRCQTVSAGRQPSTPAGFCV